MKLVSIIFLSCLVFANTDHHPEDHFQHLPAGGRRALHGMVIFGSGPYFLEHIPMNSPPHDFQIIARVRLKDSAGKEIARDLAHAGFSLKPAGTFSLNDYVAGRLKRFSGSVHEGSFEQGGEILPGLGNVEVEVLEYRVIRQLPADSQQSAFRLEIGGHVFESNVIRPAAGHDVQEIRNVVIGKVLWCVKGPDFFEACDR